MKNKIYIIAVIFLIQISLFGKINAKEIKFNAEEIEILKEENLTIANNGIAFIEEDNITLEGKEIKYLHRTLLMQQPRILKLEILILVLKCERRKS